MHTVQMVLHEICSIGGEDMYTPKTLVAVGVICYFVGFLVCLAIFNHICNDCLKSTFERERATEKMYTDALERLSDDQRNDD